MSSYKCKLPENPNHLPDPAGRPGYTTMYFPELEFPRKLEACNVRIWHGSNFVGLYSTQGGIATKVREMWLLAPNVIKIDNGSYVWVEYNVSIQVTYHNCSDKE